MFGLGFARAVAITATVALFLGSPGTGHAGGLFRPRRNRTVVVTPAPTVTVVRPTVATTPARPPQSSGTLGTFVATPYMFVRGNGPAGGGYSPLGQFGDATMAMYGPLSPQRYTAAPVLTYSRGYNGETVVTPGTSFSTPNLSRLTPVIYPTQASNYFGFRNSGEPPWWPSAINWIDQN